MAEKQNIEELNIYQRLAKIRKAVEVVQKDKAGYGYRYVSDEELLAKISGYMERYHLSLHPRIVPGTLTVEPFTYSKIKKEKEDGKTIRYEDPITEILVKGEMQYIWINNDNPSEHVVVDWVLVGHQSDGSQSFGSALTYSMRYFLLKFFNVATPDDDPDEWRRKQLAAEKEEDAFLAGELTKVFDAELKAYLADNPKKRDEIVKFIADYEKTSNYFKITDSALAQKLLTDFRAKYGKGA